MRVIAISVVSFPFRLMLKNLQNAKALRICSSQVKCILGKRTSRHNIPGRLEITS